MFNSLTCDECTFPTLNLILSGNIASPALSPEYLLCPAVVNIFEHHRTSRHSAPNYLIDYLRLTADLFCVVVALENIQH
jgi:hypothetical protein